MNDRWKIFLGLICFMALITTPIWLNIALGRTSAGPEIVICTVKEPGRDKCVLEKREMTATHMDLLNRWRDEVVRQDRRIFLSHDGKVYSKSLTGVCLDCHSNKDKFCDACHNYMGVDPYCWSCHLEPGELK